MKAYDIGLSAIRAHTQTLNTIGNNIANAATPGYHRQRVDLMTRPPNYDGHDLIGSGVEVANIRQVIDYATEDGILRNQGQLGRNQAALDIASEIETLLTPDDNSIHASLSEFFNSLESVANAPEVETLSSELIVTAQSLLDQFSEIQNSLLDQRGSLLNSARDGAEEINRAISEIAGLNRNIQIARARGQSPNDLLDRRDQTLNELAQWTDVSLQRNVDGRDIVTIGSGAFSFSDLPKAVEVAHSEDGWGLVFAGTDRTVSLNGGRIGGLLEAVNETIPETLERLDQLASAIVRNIDQQHAQGLTKNGAFSVIQATRAVDDASVPLEDTDLAFPVTKGEFTLTVTDTGTGSRTSHRVAIDPAVDSLQDIAARISALSNVNAAVNLDSGLLRISGAGPYQIDFAGRTDNSFDLTSFSGSSVPLLSGDYEGSANDNWTVSFNNSGTVGVTDGLRATVTSSSGQIIGTLDVGSGYVPGVPLVLADGLSLQFSTGTVAATDTTSALVTADSDPTGVLSALGLNSFFSGSTVGEFAVRSDLLQRPENMALSSSGQPGDAGNFAALAGLRDLQNDELDDRTFIEELADFTADAGLAAAHAAGNQELLTTYATRLQEQRESVSGVSTEEEFLLMLEVERAFQAAARFISTVDETLTEIMGIIQ
ncbi:MAG: flagellar hook-associated protein FlgK [Fuerstiella sp.]